jgi:hypothetical protein
MATKMPRVSIAVDQTIFDKVVSYWHENKFKNQTQGILDLISKGLNIVENNGNYQPPPAPLPADIEAVVNMYQALDRDDQGEIRGMMKQMLKAPKYNAPKKELKNA